jgi:hypothetical protein
MRTFGCWSTLIIVLPPMPPTPMEATWNMELGDLALRMAGAEIVVASDC